MRKIHSIFFIFWATFLIITHTKQINYLRIPFKRAYTSTHEAHNIEVQINQFVYKINVTPQKADDHILKLSDADKHHSRSKSPDYRKYPESLYGLIRSTAVQKVDKRLPRLKQFMRNTMFYFKNIEQKTLWTNQKSIKQIPWNQRDQPLYQGAFNVGPNKESYVFDDILKYSPYMNYPIVTWKLDDNQKQGEIILGHFPLELLQNQSDYQRVEIHPRQEEDWMLQIESIHLKNINTPLQQISKAQNTQISSNLTRLKVNLSQRKVKLPKIAVQSIVQKLQGCQLAMSSTGGKPIVCKTSKLDHYKQFYLQLNINKGEYSIDLPLQHFIYQVTEVNFILNIQVGTNQDYQISPDILKEYLIGIDYRQNILYIGKKASDSIISLQLLINIFIGINIIILIFSLLVISIASKFTKNPQNSNQGETQLSQSKQDIYQPKAGGYIMSLSQQYSPSGRQGRMEGM